MNHPKSQRAFTIVELMVVMVMIVIIASILYFILSGWRTETARTEVQNDLKNMAAELQQ
jgi:prepilin-type N-terminal cleavage/methylation domain-containing protein